MSANLVALVLFAAVLHAGWNTLVKSGGSPLFSIAAYRLVAAILSLGVLWAVPWPGWHTWPFIAASVLFHSLYYLTLAQAYRGGDLSMVYPLFRGMAPLLVAGGAAWWVGEWLSREALGGVCLISAGLLSLTVLGDRRARITLPTLTWSSATAVLIAAYTITDGAGVRTVDNSLSYILWLFVLESLPICLWLWMTERKAWIGFLNRHRIQVLTGGLTSAAAYGIVIHAMGVGAIALVSSLRETSVIFAAVFGALLLKEPFGRQRIMAAIGVALGIGVIRYHG